MATSPGPSSAPVSGLPGPEEMDVGAELELAEGSSFVSDLHDGDGPPPPASSVPEDLAVRVRMAKARQAELELSMKGLLEEQARNDAALAQGEAETLQLQQASRLKSAWQENANLISARRELAEDLREDSEESFHEWTEFGLELEATLLEGCLLPVKERTAANRSFITSAFRVVKRRQEDGTLLWSAEDQEGVPLDEGSTFPYLPPTFFVDIMSPKEELRAVEALRHKAFFIFPRLPGCQSCGGSHTSAVCSFRTTAKCVYPRCVDGVEHSILTCPSLHSRCEVCFARGHSKVQDVCRDIVNNFTLFEDYADMGVCTSLRRADPAWGQWSIQGPQGAANVRAAGYYNLVRQGPVRVGRWLRHITRATQALLGLEIPARKGVAQVNVAAAPEDMGKRLGWSIFPSSSQTAFVQPQAMVPGPAHKGKARSSSSTTGGSRASRQESSSSPRRSSVAPSTSSRCGKRKPSSGREGNKSSRRKTSPSSSTSASKDTRASSASRAEPGLGRLTPAQVRRLRQLLTEWEKRYPEDLQSTETPRAGSPSSSRSSARTPGGREGRGDKGKGPGHRKGSNGK